MSSWKVALKNLSFKSEDYNLYKNYRELEITFESAFSLLIMT